jgi:glycosyltransferase involved in cell wall biosynthesis
MFSTVIITFNEEKNIERCLQSLASWCDDIVVVDSFSTDATAELCGQYPQVRLFFRKFEGYSDQKNFGHQQAHYPLIFSIDADEAVSDELASSILAWQNAGSIVPASLNRRTWYCGKKINHSGWYPDTKIRFFHRETNQWGGPKVHEYLEDITTGQPGQSKVHLQGDLLHFSYYSIEEHLHRAKKYAALGAQVRAENGKTTNFLQLVFSPAFKFFKLYVLRLGFLDGKAGWNIARISALETWWKYRPGWK